MAIKFNGVDNLLQKLEKVGSPDLEAAMEKACLIVEAAAKQNAPKDTGALRNSIESRVETKEGEIQGIVFTPLEYAPYVEYGTGLFAENGGRIVGDGKGEQQKLAALELLGLQLEDVALHHHQAAVAGQLLHFHGAVGDAPAHDGLAVEEFAEFFAFSCEFCDDDMHQKQRKNGDNSV